MFFQLVDHELKEKLSIEKFLYNILVANKNFVIRFEPYAVYYAGAALVSVESISNYVIYKLNLEAEAKQFEGDPRFFNPGYGLMRNWTHEYLQKK